MLSKAGLKLLSTPIMGKEMNTYYGERNEKVRAVCHQGCFSAKEVAFSYFLQIHVKGQIYIDLEVIILISYGN